MQKSTKSNLTDRAITMHAIRYLGLMTEALAYHASRRVADSQSAIEAAKICSNHIEHTAQYDIEELSIQSRMRMIAESLDFAAMLRKRYDSIFEAPCPSVPSLAEIGAIGLEAQRLADGAAP